MLIRLRCRDRWVHCRMSAGNNAAMLHPCAAFSSVIVSTAGVPIEPKNHSSHIRTSTMERTANAAVNAVIGFGIGYLVASRSLDRQEALKSALLSSAITAVIGWLVYGRAEG